MDKWGHDLGTSDSLSMDEKAEIIAALYEGYKRQEEAFGYCRAYGALISTFPGGLSDFGQHLPFDLISEINNSEFTTIAKVPLAEFEAGYIEALNNFVCPTTGMKF